MCVTRRYPHQCSHSDIVYLYKQMLYLSLIWVLVFFTTGDRPFYTLFYDCYHCVICVQ